MKLYCIADNNGAIWAHDIQGESKAQSMLNDIIADIGDDEAQKIELEIIEQ